MSPIVAIAGCPNAGKTTLFNRLTGASHTVGNWPGHTVDRHEGAFSVAGRDFRAVDLPGTYGLVAISAEESIATGFLCRERPAVVVTVIDATNLCAGLHFVAQIAEAGLRQVVALNMSDVADRRRIAIDTEHLATRLGVDVVRTVARRGDGIDELQDVIAAAATAPEPAPLVLDYGPVVERHLGGLTETAVAHPAVLQLGPSRWTMLQLLAGDEQVTHAVAALPGGNEVLTATDATRRQVAAELGFDVETALAERRLDRVTKLLDEVSGPAEPEPTWRERLDRVLTHQGWGLPVFLAVMWAVLRVTSDVTAPFLDWIDATISGPVSHWAAALLQAMSLDGTWVEGLVIDGVIAGVGGVLVFVPVLFGLYLMLALLEDSGYMARAAAVMDRAMRAVGIPGKAFLPMMVGFGCTVPAIAATRTLDSPRDRLLTGLLTPFMSCGARLPVYVLLAGVFFTGKRSTIVFAMYLLGIAVAVLIGLLLSRTVLREREPAPFVMVLPEFRLPSGRTVWALVTQRTWAFIKGAGTVILAASVAVWFLLAIPLGSGGGSFGDTDVEHSAFGGISKAVAPVLAPAGFGDWEQSGSLLTGFVAKEVVVSTMTQLYTTVDTTDEPTGSFGDDLRQIGSGFVTATADTLRAIPGVIGLDGVDVHDDSSTGLQSAIRASFDRSSGGHAALAGFAFLVFVLLYTPCIATVAAFRHEFGTRWMWVCVVGQFVVAWLGAFFVFQGGRLLGLG
jgi:ferrous iron transport protein B